MNYLLSSCTGFGPERVKHFVKSYSLYAEDVKLVVFGGNLPDTTIESIHDVGGIFIDVSQRYNKFHGFTVRALSRIQRKFSVDLFRTSFRVASEIDKRRFGTSNGLQFQITGMQSLRYIEYLKYVSTLPAGTNIFISDIRDVIFQSSIFDLPLRSLELYAEENNIIGQCEYNRMWMVQAVGPRVTGRYMDKPVLCSGTTAGTAESLRLYLSLMVKYVDNACIPLGPLDQAFHNHIYYGGMLAKLDVDVVPNRTGRVQTMQTQGGYVIDAGYLRNVNGGVTPVVHQWDRYSQLFDWADIHCSRKLCH
jgi:hypothetical protein